MMIVFSNNPCAWVIDYTLDISIHTAHHSNKCGSWGIGRAVPIAVIGRLRKAEYKY